MVSSHDASRDILPFPLSILLINLVLLSSHEVDQFIILKALYPTGQPAHLEEDLLINLIKSSTKIVLESSRPRRSPCRNLPPINPVEDELVRDPSLVESPHLYSISPALFCNPISGPILVFALISLLASAPVSTNELFNVMSQAQDLQITGCTSSSSSLL